MGDPGWFQPANSPLELTLTRHRPMDRDCVCLVKGTSFQFCCGKRSAETVSSLLQVIEEPLFAKVSRNSTNAADAKSAFGGPWMRWEPAARKEKRCIYIKVGA